MFPGAATKTPSVSQGRGSHQDVVSLALEMHSGLPSGRQGFPLLLMRRFIGGHGTHVRTGLVRIAVFGLVWLGGVPIAIAQELEPGAYAVAPLGMNVFIAANTSSFGDVAFDPTGPIDEGRATIHLTTLGYGRVWSLAGRSAQIAVGVPIVAGHLEGRFLGESASVSRHGSGDPRIRVAVNLYGAPAMARAAFAAQRRPRLVGASLTVSAPLGRYTSERLINIGNNRWAFKPEIGVVFARRRWTFETYGGVWLFTKNDDGYRGAVRTQAPIGSMQFHVQYAFTPRLLVSANTNYYSGGRTTVNDRANVDLQRNSRVGVTVIRPLARGRILRAAVSRGAVTTVGADFTSVAVGFQQAWGGR